MPTAYKVLGQSNPSATTATTLYTVPSSTQTVISTITVCNQSGTAGSYRVAIRPDGETLAAKHYLAYDVSISGNDNHTYTIGATMDAADVVTIYASSTSLSFNAFGSEIS
jgi:hypothetical protein